MDPQKVVSKIAVVQRSRSCLGAKPRSLLFMEWEQVDFVFRDGGYGAPISYGVVSGSMRRMLHYHMLGQPSGADCTLRLGHE